MPCVDFAGCLALGFMYWVIDGEKQSYCAIATPLVSVGVCGFIRAIRVIRAPPGETFTLRSCSVTVVAIVHCQVQCHCAVAPCHVGEGMRSGVVAGGVGLPVNPGIGVANALCIGGSGTVADGEF